MIRDSIDRYLREQKQSTFSLKAVLFDMDGVLFDSMRYHTQAWAEVANRYQLLSSPEDFYIFEGRTGEGTINELYQRTFKRNATQKEVQTIYKEKAGLFNKYSDSKPMMGAADVLEKVKSYGLQTILVTGSGQHSLFEKLQEVYPNTFEQEKMITAYDVKYGKPHPEPYLMGLKKAGVEAHEAIVVENAPMGVRSAVAANIFTIAVNTGPLADNVLLKEGPYLLYPDMVSLALDWDNLMYAVTGKQR